MGWYQRRVHGSLDSLDRAKGSRKGVLQQQQKMSNSTTELFTEGNFSYHVLTPAHKDAAHAVLARAFCSEPACTDVAEVRPDMKTEYIYWLDHCSTNGLSVVALDKENSRVAGVFIVRDLLMVPSDFDDKYKSETKTLSPWMGFLWHMDAEAIKKMPELGEPGKAVDLWFLGVHPDYRGNKIANFLTKGVMSLLKKSSFKFGTIEATNAFTSKAATWNKFTAVYSMEAKDFLWRGEPIYINVKPPHGTWTFWVKEIQKDD